MDRSFSRLFCIYFRDTLCVFVYKINKIIVAFNKWKLKICQNIKEKPEEAYIIHIFYEQNADNVGTMCIAIWKRKCSSMMQKNPMYISAHFLISARILLHTKSGDLARCLTNAHFIKQSDWRALPCKLISAHIIKQFHWRRLINKQYYYCTPSSRIGGAFSSTRQAADIALPYCITTVNANMVNAYPCRWRSTTN